LEYGHARNLRNRPIFHCHHWSKQNHPSASKL